MTKPQNLIIDVEGYPSSIISLFVVLGLFYLRYAQPHAHRPFKPWLVVPFFYLAGQCFLLTAPFLRPPSGKGDTSLPYWLYPLVGIAVLLAGVVYWTVWRLILPKIGKFTWIEKKSRLRDGTVVTEFLRSKDI